jgi:hypothetical protein
MGRGELVVTKLKAMGVASKRGECTKGASKGETEGSGCGRKVGEAEGSGCGRKVR